jgi:hypothetical protein
MGHFYAIHGLIIIAITTVRQAYPVIPHPSSSPLVTIACGRKNVYRCK